MRSLLWLCPILLAACASAPPPAEIPVRGETPGRICKAAWTARFIGRQGTSETGTEIRHATGAAVLRWAHPGMMMTMEYRADRVTVYLSADRKITKIACG